MSKKMLKRSLALGALMAFVITGSAMAATFTGETFTGNNDSNEAIYGGVFSTFTSASNYATILTDAENTFENCVFENNSAEATGINSYAYGGVIYSEAGHTLNVVGCEFNNNTLSGADNAKSNAHGAAIANNGGVLVVNGSTFDGNITNKKGGSDCYGSAIFSSGTTTITNSTFKNQSGGRAVYVSDGTTTLEGNIFTQNVRGGINVELGADEVVLKGTNQFLDNESNSIKAKGKVTFAEDSTTIFSGNECDIDICNGAVVTIEENSVVDAGSGLNNDDGKNTSGKLIVNGTLGIGGDSSITTLEGNGTLKFLDAVTIDVTNNNTVGLTLAANGVANDAVGGNVEELLSGFNLNGEENTEMVLEEGNLQGEKVVNLFLDDENNLVGTEVISESVNTKSDAVSDAGMALKVHYRAHMNDMNKRMGELRMANGETGVWTRMVRGENEYEGAKSQYNQYQLGYDEKLSVDKRWTVGAAVTFAEGDANYGQGSTDDKSTAFAIYGSKLNNDGTFVDLNARYAHLESDLDDVNSGKGDYATNGMSVSAEFGKRIQQGNGLWVEPQVELTYGTIDSAEFKFDSGKAVQVGDMDSLIGRVGFRIGKDLEQGNVYARASYLYDFEGETENAFSNGTDSRTIAEDLGGGWWEVGVGANVNLSKATYVYADVEKTFGGEVDTNWQWNLGLRYSF